MALLQVGTYNVTYTAADSSGNVGVAARRVLVVSPCTGTETMCTATCYCSQYGLCSPSSVVGSTCAGSTSAAIVLDTTPPVITMLGAAPVNTLSQTSSGTAVMITNWPVGELAPPCSAVPASHWRARPPCSSVLASLLCWLVTVTHLRCRCEACAEAMPANHWGQSGPQFI